VVISPTGSYDPEFFSALAQKISVKLTCACMHFEFGDASGVIEYNLFENGQRTEGYSFGPDYSEEMAEYGGFVREAKDGEILIHDSEQEYIYYNANTTHTAAPLPKSKGETHS